MPLLPRENHRPARTPVPLGDLPRGVPFPPELEGGACPSGGRGGSWLDQENLVTACWPCNTGKADLRLEEVGWTLLSEEDVRSDWDGLTSATNHLWERAGQPDVYREWRRALVGLPTGGSGRSLALTLGDESA